LCFHLDVDEHLSRFVDPRPGDKVLAAQPHRYKRLSAVARVTKQRISYRIPKNLTKRLPQ
jgi:hypothetical protein